MTREQFIEAYRAQIIASYAWAKKPEKLEKFMASMANTLTGEVTTWSHEGKSTEAAWKQIGGKGKPTLKALRALPSKPVSAPRKALTKAVNDAIARGAPVFVNMPPVRVSQAKECKFCGHAYLKPCDAAKSKKCRNQRRAA